MGCVSCDVFCLQLGIFLCPYKECSEAMNVFMLFVWNVEGMMLSSILVCPQANSEVGLSIAMHLCCSLLARFAVELCCHGHAAVNAHAEKECKHAYL